MTVFFFSRKYIYKSDPGLFVRSVSSLLKVTTMTRTPYEKIIYLALCGKGLLGVIHLELLTQKIYIVMLSE